MNGIKGTKPFMQKCDQLLDAVVVVLKYNKINIYHAIYIKVLYDGTVSIIMVYKYGVINNTSNDTEFTEPRRFFEEYF